MERLYRSELELGLEELIFFQKVEMQFKNYIHGMVLAQKQTHKSVAQNREPRKEPILIWSINL